MTVSDTRDASKSFETTTKAHFRAFLYVLAKVLFLTVVVSVLVSTARACYGWPYQRARFDTLCDREPDRLLCEKLKLGPVHVSAEKNGADAKGKGNESNEGPAVQKDCK